MSINRTLTGKLAVDDQNFICCVRFEENIKKSPKKLIPEKAKFLMVFGRFLLTERSKFNSDHLPPANLSGGHYQRDKG